MFPGRCLHTIFEERSRAVAGRVALSTPDGPVTYGGLDARSGRLASRLRELGVGPGVLVGLCARRSAEAIVGMLGILRAGAAYVPIDPDYPAERIGYLLADSGASVVVAAGHVAGVLETGSRQVVWLDGDQLHDDAVALAEPHRRAVTEDDLAYVIYTSGSTGRPKGVAVPHRNVVRLLESTEPWFGFGAHDTWSLFHSISFDFSVWEIWGALAYGGRLVLLPERTTRSPELLVRRLREERVTVLNQTPAAFRHLLAVMVAGGLSTEDLALRLVIFGGERLDPGMLRPWTDRHGDRRPELINMYGITETTVHCTYRRIRTADVEAGAGDVSPIGVPLPDLRIHLLDADGRPVSDGTPGEMYVAGAGLARGYLNRPELTAERFLTRVWAVGEERLYRSGDRAVRLSGGELAYLGRVDDQIKVRGYRIEPGEIEQCLSRTEGVAEVVVTAQKDNLGELRLVAHLLPAVGESSPAELIAAAERRARTALPRHLRPALYKVVSEIPMTLQGKVNRHALAK